MNQGLIAVRSDSKVYSLEKSEIWAKIETLMKGKLKGTRVSPGYKNASTRKYKVPSPTTGYLVVTIQIYPRWCRIDIDRWCTTNYDPELSIPWFKDNLHPIIMKSLSQMPKKHSTILPTDGSHAYAWPLPKNEFLEILSTWMDKEKELGLPSRYPVQVFIPTLIIQK